MADFEPPSFSLGLDFDIDSEPQPIPGDNPSSPERALPPSPPNPSFSLINDDDEDFETPAVVPDSPVAEEPRTLKRLRRGPGSASGSAVMGRVSMQFTGKVDDDIEEFSSQEDRVGGNEQSSSQYHSVSSSSMFSLPRRGVLNTQPESQWKSTKRKHPSDSPASAKFETSRDSLVFPKLTISPLRRFQLLDSDSDDSSDSAPENIADDTVNASSKEKLCNPDRFPTNTRQNGKSVPSNPSQVEDLWKDFPVQKSFNIPTPALDEVCEEYFGRVKEKNEALDPRHNRCTMDSKSPYQKSSVIDIDQPLGKLDDPVPPAHRYFFHDDPRIQNLVRDRLPYFFPLGAVNNRGNQHTNPSVIDYMSQFSHGEGSKQVPGKSNEKANTTRGRKNVVEETGSGSWMNPKSSTKIPKDAGKRRVQAVGQSAGAGHWYTGSDGKRVYVNKNGQELTGRYAYLQYKRDNRGGSNRSKKKTTKTSTAKKGTTTKKKTAVRKK